MGCPLRRCDPRIHQSRLALTIEIFGDQSQASADFPFPADNRLMRRIRLLRGASLVSTKADERSHQRQRDPPQVDK